MPVILISVNHWRWPLTLHVVLTTAELDDADLVVTAVGNHFSGNLRTFDDRQADFHVFAIGNQQDAVEIDRFAGSDVEFLDLRNSPSVTLCCLPPVTITAYMCISVKPAHPTLYRSRNRPAWLHGVGSDARAIA